MRLIDADKLIKEFLNVCRIEFEIKNKCLADENVLSIIQNAPTVERPQGEWLEDSGNIACSHCHTIWLYRKTDFCPHCGADMRGGEE